MRRMLTVTVLAFIVSIVSISPAVAQAPMKCDLGQTDSGLKACKAVTYLVRFAVHPVGDVDWVIENAKAAVEQARLEGAPNVVLLQIQLPWLIAKALAADALRHISVIEESGIVPNGFLDETAVAVARARKAGADVSDLERRLQKQLADLYQLGPASTGIQLIR